MLLLLEPYIDVWSGRVYLYKTLLPTPVSHLD